MSSRWQKLFKSRTYTYNVFQVIGVFQYTQGTYEDLEKTCKISGSKPGYKFEDRKVLNAFR